VTEARADTKASTPGRPALAAGVLWTFFGQGVPLAVALFTIPVLVAGYGTDRFGVLALVWAAVGYFTLFDLGMGRALTQWVAGRVDRHASEDTGATIWTALALMGLLGVLGGGVLAALTPWLVETVLSMPQELVGEARTSFLLMAVLVPLLTFDQALRGILEAHLKFAIVNAVRIPFGTLTQLGPLLLLLFSNSLVPAVVVIVLSRVAEGLIYLRYCLRLQPELRGRIRIHLRSVLPLVRFGGWITVSNVIGPLMVYFDRFLIGSLLSVAATAHYAAPYDLVTRLWIVPGAFCAVLFPVFAASARSDPSRVVRLYVGGLKYTFVSLFPLIFLVVVFAPDLLTLWIGAEFARASAGVLQILALGVLVNSLAHIAFALVQGLGRADVTAKFHLLEAPFYLALLWWGIAAYGIEGAAVAWTIRVTVDAALLAIASTRLAGCPPRAAARVGLALGLGGALAVLVAIAGSVVTKLMLALPILCVFLMLSWFFALSAEDRQFLTFRGAMR
jgi:O-antigen/teichoic acid export membrane protein